MRIPAADIDKSQPVLVAHQARHAPGFVGEGARTGGATAGLLHLFAQLRGHLLTQRQTFARGCRKRRCVVHLRQDLRLPRIQTAFADPTQRHIGQIAAALKRQRQRIGKRNRRHPAGAPDKRAMKPDR